MPVTNRFSGSHRSTYQFVSNSLSTSTSSTDLTVGTNRDRSQLDRQVDRHVDSLVDKIQAEENGNIKHLMTKHSSSFVEENKQELNDQNTNNSLFSNLLSLTSRSRNSSTNDNMNREYLNGECCVVGSPSPVIVKPNNQQYFQQGAVDSSSRLARLKYNTINKNAQSFRKPFGDEAVSAAQYTASGNTPFFIKSITQQPQCPRPAYRPDAFTVCSVTNPAETYRQNKTTQVVSHSNKY